MDKMAPKCGESAVEKCCEKYPAIEQADRKISAVDITEKAVLAATTAVLSFKDEAMEYCDDVVDSMMDGENPFTAMKNTLRSIVVELLRALQNGVKAAARAVTDIIPDCCESCCLNLFQIDIPALCKE